MQKKNVLLELLKLIGMVIAGWLLWLIIFSTFMPADETGATTEPFPGAIVILGIATALIVSLVVKYNTMQKAFQKTKAAFSNITVLKERADRLLEKANKVADKYMVHEEQIQIGVAEKRAPRPRMIRNAEQFQMQLENYPDLKANESIAQLLSQIREAENAYAQSKIDYNTYVEYYNTSIHLFPNNLLRKIFKFEDAAFYTNEEDSEISDEALGIA